MAEWLVPAPWVVGPPRRLPCCPRLAVPCTACAPEGWAFTPALKAAATASAAAAGAKPAAAGLAAAGLRELRWMGLDIAGFLVTAGASIFLPRRPGSRAWLWMG